MNLINARYKLNEDEIEFLIEAIDNSIISLQNFNYDIKFIRKIISKTLEISVNDKYVFLNFFNKIDINQKDIEIDLQTEVKSFLVKLRKDLSKEDLKHFFSLSSNYSRAIYKLLKAHEHKSLANINLDDLKAKLQVSKALNLYSNFKMKVLLVAQQEIAENTDISFNIKEKKDGKKVNSIIFEINSKSVKKVSIIEEKKDVEQIKPIKLKKEVKKDISNLKLDEQNEDIKRIVSFFDLERKKLQPNYVRKESSYNMSGEYLLRVHLKETGRTPQMFFDAIRWLFSNNPKASFHRQYIMNIGKLIEHFNTLEHQAMYSKEAIEFNEEAQIFYNIYKKQGLSEDEILEKLREGEYI